MNRSRRAEYCFYIKIINYPPPGPRAIVFIYKTYLQAIVGISGDVNLLLIGASKSTYCRAGLINSYPLGTIPYFYNSTIVRV